MMTYNNQQDVMTMMMPSFLPAPRQSCTRAVSLESGSPQDDQPSIKRRRRHAVSFSETSSAVILPVRSKDDASRLYYSRSDLATFKLNHKAYAVALRETRTSKLMKHVAYLAAASVSSNNSADDTSSSSSSLASQLAEEAAYELSPNSKAAIRGMEPLICPTVCKLLVRRRRKVVESVLEAQAQHMNNSASPMMMYGGHADLQVLRIAQASMKQSKFSKE